MSRCPAGAARHRSNLHPAPCLAPGGSEHRIRPDSAEDRIRTLATARGGPMSHFRPRRTSSIVTAVLVLLAGAPALADVLVFDRAAKTVSRLDVVSLAVKASAALPDVPTRAVVSSDGKTVVVLCRGEGGWRDG